MRASEFQPRKLVIFDIDDTLVHTQTKVHVIKDGQTIKELNSHEFTHYKLQPGESFDFGRFKDARDFFENSKPIIPMINQLKHDIATGNKVVMVTARADFNDRELFLDTFRKYGVDMSKVHVYRAGNMTIKAQTEEKKKIIIRDLLSKAHYTKAIMYDDAVPNLESFVELKDEFPKTKFYAWHVSLEGEASEYHRTNEDYSPNVATGPETKPTMPAGTVRVDVSDVYDWYKLGKDISNLKGAKPSNYGKGPPSTIMSFGSEEEEHKYINNLKKLGLTTTDIDPLDPNQPKSMPRQKTDPTYNVNEFVVDNGEGDEEHALRKYARMWYNGDLHVQHKIEKILDRMGWEIGELESEEVGAFVVRSGDENGDSYIGFAPNDLTENFADGRNPQDKGDSKRHGVPTKASVSSLRKFAKSHSGRAAQLAHWMANMKSGKKK